MTPALLRIERPEELAPLGESLAALDIGLTLVDSRLRICWANTVVEGLGGTCEGDHCFASLWQRRRRCADCLPLLVFRTGEVHEGLRERGRPGQAPEVYRVRATPVLDGTGEVRWVAETLVRLTTLAPELSGSRAALAAESASAMGAAMVVIDRQECIVSWGPEATATFGFSVDEALGRRIDLIVPPELLDEEREISARIAAGERVPRTDTFRMAKDGRRVLVALSAVGLRDEAHNLIGRSCVLRDLSALQELRSRVAAQDQMLAHIGHEAAEAIIGTDLSGRITSWNRAAEELLGRSAAAALGEEICTLAASPECAQLFALTRGGGPVRGQRMTWRHASGAEVPVEASARQLVRSTGEPLGLALIARDVSASIRLERQMMRSEKLAVVGSLAAGLAHEVGTPLNVISATAEYLLLDGVSAPQAARLRGIVAETDRISRLVRELLSVARTPNSEPVPLALGDAVERVLSFLQATAHRKQVRLDADLPAELPLVIADPDGVQQVLLNLVVNALHAVPEGGHVRVSARRTFEGGEPLVALAVDDDGPGVPDELRERIFDPFFTTRADGTGLGLAVCAHVAARNRADLRVGRGPLGGASFTVQLRQAEAQP